MKRLLLAFATSVAGLSAYASAPPEPAPPFVLVAPQAGAHLRGGSDSTLVWSAASLPDGVNEWEAFLSLDGGTDYPLRITPHLDAGIRSFRWHVPNVAGNAVRILIRVGNERDERLVVLPQTFTIEPTYAPLDLAALQRSPTDAVGEAALNGGEPVVQWVGVDLVTHQHRDRGLTGTASAIRVASSDGCAAAGFQHVTLRRPQRGASLTFRKLRRPAADSRGALRPLFLLTTRLNV